MTLISTQPPNSHHWPARIIGTALIASGLIHLGLWMFIGRSWEGPVSLRKPALFGISAGLTVLSLIWIASRLRPKPEDRWLVVTMSSLLLGEVALVTIQFWRGVPSHFNRSSLVDATIEHAMLAMIAVVTVGIGRLCWRSVTLPDFDRTDQLGLRAGLWFLFIGCLLGFVTTGLGYANLAIGRPAEVWGTAGVLKFPHGAALHAIQLFPLLNWCAQRAGVARRQLLIWSAILSQAIFLVYASRQTALGRTRLDTDEIGGSLLALSIALAILPGWLIVWSFAKRVYWRLTERKTAEHPCSKRMDDQTSAVHPGNVHVH